MTKRAALFVVLALLLGGVSLSLAWYLGEEALFSGALAAYGLTVIPAFATFLWAQWASATTPENHLVAGLGGTLVRLVVAFGGALFLQSQDPVLFGGFFWYWLIGFYLIFLTLDITLLVRVPPPSAGSLPEDPLKK